MHTLFFKNLPEDPPFKNPYTVHIIFFLARLCGVLYAQLVNFFKRILSKIIETNYERLVNNKLKLLNPQIIKQNPQV